MYHHLEKKKKVAFYLQSSEIEIKKDFQNKENFENLPTSSFIYLFSQDNIYEKPCGDVRGE